MDRAQLPVLERPILRDQESPFQPLFSLATRFFQRSAAIFVLALTLSISWFYVRSLLKEDEQS